MTSNLSRFKRIKLNFNFAKVLLTTALIFSMLMQGLILPVSAAPTTKTMTVTIGEGGVDQSSLSETINIPNLKSIVGVSTDTGSVSHSINGDNVTLNTTGGNPSRTNLNQKKYPKYVTDHIKTTNTSGIPSTVEFSADGYVGFLQKKGLPAASRYVEEDAGPPSYNTHPVIKSISRETSRGNHEGNLKFYYDNVYVRDLNPQINDKQLDSSNLSNYLNSNYAGTSILLKTYDDGSEHYFKFDSSYSPSTHFRPASASFWSGPGGNDFFWSEAYMSRANPKYYIVKNEYRQDYSGTVYKAGIDSFYKYTVTVEYVDNQEPTLTTKLPSANSYFGKEDGHNAIYFEGIVKDDDTDDSINVRYTLFNKNKGTNLTGHTNKLVKNITKSNGTNHSFNYTINVDGTIPDEEYTLKVMAEDDKGAKTEKNVIIFIDNTGPTTNPELIEVLHDSSIKVGFNAADNGVGLHEIETYIYNRNEEDITSWLTESSFIDEGLIANKKYIYKAKSKDKLDNTGAYSDVLTKYTLALDPLEVQLVESFNNYITLKVINNTTNEIVPDTRIILKEKGTGTVASTADWSKDESKIITGLVEGKQYEVYLNTRNEDGVENGEIKLSSTSNPPLVDSDGNPIDEVVTVVPVSNFKLIGSSVSTLKVSWDKVSNQEYQTWLVDENGNEVAESRSLWLKDNIYEFKDINLLPNTKYIAHITTRRENSTFSMSPVIVNNTGRSYTNAEGISKGSFEADEDSIEVTLVVDSLNNPSDTEYIIKNDITGQTETVTHSNPIWDNTNLAKESYYEYSVRVINKNGEPSYFTKLIFINGEEPHTYIPNLDIDDDIIDKPDHGDVVNLDDLQNWDPSTPIWFNPEDLNGKYVQLGGEIFIITRNKMETIKNKDEIEVSYYAFSKEGFGYTDWKELKEGFFEDKVYFNTPGYYKTHFKFKDYVRESKPLVLNYLADWVAPSINAENKVKGQTVVTGNNFDIRLSAEDNISEYLFYSTDNGSTYYLLKDTITDVSFLNINKSTAGVQNNCTIRITDINGNVSEKAFSVWGISKN